MLSMILSTEILIPTFKEWPYTLWVRQTSRLFHYRVTCYRTSLVAQMVKNLPSMQETRVWSLGWEDPLEKNMANDSSLLAWRIPWTEEPGGLQSMESQTVRHDCATNIYMLQHYSLSLTVWWQLKWHIFKEEIPDFPTQSNAVSPSVLWSFLKSTTLSKSSLCLTVYFVSPKWNGNPVTTDAILFTLPPSFSEK